jgi:RNA polymerase sigma-70 factor (ECF subfamily)
MPKGSATRTWVSTTDLAWRLTVVAPADEPSATDSNDLSALHDRELVARTVAGEPAAFDVLVERHRRAVYQICFRFVHHHEDASDLAQEVFVRAWRGLPRFNGHAAFSTWLYRISVNACLNTVTARPVAAEPLEDVESVEDVRAERPGASLLKAERADAVRRAIHALPKRQRATLVLRMYHELTHQQIAEVLGTSVGAVKANFFHALGNLRRILGRQP